jgi:hypothetical protein
MKKGISTLISFVLLLLISIVAIYLVLNIIKPTVEMVFESAAMNEADQNMQLLDNLIREVASEGTGSLRSVLIKVSDGDYRLLNTSGNFTGAFQFKIDLKHSPFEAPMFKKIGNLKYTAGMNSAGLVGYWKFDEGNGTLLKDWSYENDGTIYNGSVSCANPPNSDGCPVWVDGKFGRALNFDGIDDFVEIGYDDSIGVENGDFVLEAWIKGTHSQKDEKIYVLTLQDDFGFIISFGLNNESLGMWCRFTDNSNATAYLGHDVLDGTWHHVVVKRSDNTYYFYDNGVFINSSTQTKNLMSQKTVRTIGGWNATSGNFNGTIDEVRIYNRALSEEEIKENYNARPSNYQVVLEYSRIALTGNLKLGKGTHKICIEKIGELNNKPLVEIAAC